MKEPRVVESIANECQSLGRAHESSSARAEQLIDCLEGEIAKRDEELAACRVAVENCEVFRARLARYEDADGRPLQLSFPAEFLEHVKHARKELCRKETAPFHVRQRLAQKLTDCIAALSAGKEGE